MFDELKGAGAFLIITLKRGNSPPLLFAGINRNNPKAHLITEGVMSAIVSNVYD